MEALGTYLTETRQSAVLTHTSTLRTWRRHCKTSSKTTESSCSTGADARLNKTIMSGKIKGFKNSRNSRTTIFYLTNFFGRWLYSGGNKPDVTINTTGLVLDGTESTFEHWVWIHQGKLVLQDMGPDFFHSAVPQV